MLKNFVNRWKGSTNYKLFVMMTIVTALCVFTPPYGVINLLLGVIGAGVMCVHYNNFQEHDQRDIEGED